MTWLLVVLVGAMPLVATIAGKAMAPFLIVFSLLGLVHIARQRLWGISRTAWMMAGIAVVLPTLSALWSIRPEVSLHSALEWGAVLLAGMVMVVGCQRDARWSDPRIGKALVTGLIIASVLVLAECWLGSSLIQHVHAWVRTDKAFDWNNLNRGAAVLAILLWPALMHADQAGWRRAYVPLILCVVAAVFSLQSLAASLAVLVGLISWGWLRFWPNGARIWMVGMIMVVASFPFLDAGVAFDSGCFADLCTASYRYLVFCFGKMVGGTGARLGYAQLPLYSRRGCALRAGYGLLAVASA